MWKASLINNNIEKGINQNDSSRREKAKFSNERNRYV